MKERVYLFDTTLRDGAQTSGVDFTLDDKVKIARLLDDLGVDYVEGGYPGANPTDSAFFEEKRTRRARFTAFGMTKRAGVSVSNDPGLAALLAAEADANCFVAKSWDYHVHVALGTTLEENVSGVRQTVEAAIARNREAMIDCEHFFDGFKANPTYALDVARAAYDSGARWVVLCDTNGGTLPHEVDAIVRKVTEVVPGSHLGIHAHETLGLGQRQVLQIHLHRLACRIGHTHPALGQGAVDPQLPGTGSALQGHAHLLLIDAETAKTADL